ncbi:MAG: cupin domain-containing protein [Pseudomonadota bacterium]
MTPAQLDERVVRYNDLKPCRTAFIDAHTPGSNQKENYTIIGGGVSESADQYVHLSIPHGFNIGAAAQPPMCKNSLHAHRTAEVFFVLTGRWRFFWGQSGDAGEVVLEPGDIFNIPTGIFRGFENIGDEYGMIMAILGGDDAGGGVEWAPQVLAEAQAHGLVLSDKGRLYDTKRGEALPDGEMPMKLLNMNELQAYPEPDSKQVVAGYVRRYWDMVAIADRNPVTVIGEEGIIRDKPGFEVHFLTRKSAQREPLAHVRPSVLMPVRGDWKVEIDDFETILGAGDTMSVPENAAYTVAPASDGGAALYRVVGTEDSAGPTWTSGH